MTDPILFETHGHVVTLTLNKPAELNPLSDPDMIDGLVEACDRINADQTVRAVIVTGAGRAFSAGGNVKHMRDRTDMFAGPPERIAQAYRSGMHRLPVAVYGLEVPLIAAVNGPTVGAALDLVCLADIRLAAETASFTAGFVKIGIGPGDGAAWFLPRAVGLSRAAEILFTGDTLSAEDAVAAGLVTRVCADDALMDAAREMAERICANAPLAIRETKRLLRAGQEQDLVAHLNDCARTNARLHHSADHAEAIAAFFAKRPAKFEGR